MSGISYHDRFAFFWETVMRWFIFELSRNFPQNGKTRKLMSCYIDRWDIPSSELQRCSWLSERWQQISSLDMCCSSLPHPWPAGCILSCKNYRSCQPPPKDVVLTQKSISPYLPGLLDRELNQGPGGTKLMLYHWAIHTSYWKLMINRNF